MAGRIGRATFLDAFAASSRLQSTYLGQETAELKERNDLELKNFSARYATDVQNYLRDNPYIGGVDEADDERAYDDYVSKMITFVNEKYSFGKDKNKSPYYQKVMEQMQKQSVENIRNIALVKQDEWRVSREVLNREKDINAINSAGWEPKDALEADYNRLNLSAQTMDISPLEMNALRQKAERDVFQNYATDRMSQEKDVNNLNAVMDEIRQKFDFMPPTIHKIYDKDGNEIGEEERPWSYEGKDEWEKTLLKNTTERIRKEHFDFFREKQAYMDRLIVSGNIDTAIQFAKQWGAEWNKYYNPNNPQHANTNEDFLDRGSRYFDWRTLEERERQGSTGRAMNLLDFYNLEMFIRPQLTPGSDGTVPVGYLDDGSPVTVNYASLQDAMQGFLHYKREAFFATYARDGESGRNAMTMQLWEAEQARFFEQFYNEVGQALNNISPSLSSDFKKFRDVDTYIRSNGDFYTRRNVAGLDDEAKREYGEKCVEFFHSIFFNGITDAPTIQRLMREFTGSEITKVLEWRRTPDNEGELLVNLKKFSDMAMSDKAEDVLYKLHTPERLNVSAEASRDSYVFRTKEQEDAVNKISEEERRRIAVMMGQENITDLVPSWMPSERRKGEVIPKSQFTISSGENAGTYYLAYDNNSNPVVMKKNQDGKWEETEFRTERTRTRNEQTVHEQTIRDQFERNRHDYNLQIRDNKNPLTGETSGFDHMEQWPPDTTLPSTPEGMEHFRRAWGNRSELYKTREWLNYYQRQAMGR